MLKRSFFALLILTAFTRPSTALQLDDVLAIGAMPLVVAEVAEIEGVPLQPLIDFVSLLNEADVPPVQFVEVVRYSPIALVEVDGDRNFVQDVRVWRDEGARGTNLVTVIERRYRTYGFPDLSFSVTAPRVATVNHVFVPQIVRTRVVERKAHPHGGPPGQLKKIVGVQTGAEIVHGDRRGDDRDVVGRKREVHVTGQVKIKDSDSGKIKIKEREKSSSKSAKGPKGKGKGKS